MLVQNIIIKNFYFFYIYLFFCDNLTILYEKSDIYL